MSANWNPDDGDELEEEENESILYGRDAVLFVVDGSNSFVSEEDQFRTCLSLIEITMMNRIIQSDKDLIGVIFYNTQHSPAPKNQTDIESLVPPKNTAIFMHLSTMSKETIGHMKHFKESDDFFDFKNRYGSSTTESFVDVLWLSSRMLMRCGYKLRQSTVILFTNNDQPYQESTNEFDRCIVRAKDLSDQGVHFMVVPMNDDFNMDHFYKEFVCSVNNFDSETHVFKKPNELRDMLSNRVFHKDYRFACSRYFDLKIGDGLTINCGLYQFSQRSKTTPSVHLLASTNDIVVSRRTYLTGSFNEETAEFEYNKRLLPGEQRKVMDVGGQRIIFTPEELTKVKSMVEPGMRLLGFKPMTNLPTNCAVKNTKFIYPNEKTIKGSKKLFRALWEKCIEKDKYALCVFAQMRKVAPRYVALVPQQRELMENDGFRVIYLPMQTDIRNLDIFNNETPDLSSEAIEPLKKIVKKLKFHYKPEIFENPHQRMFFANLEALVFEQEGETTEDTTLPDVDFQDSKIQPFVDHLIQMFGKDTFAITSKRASTSQPNEEPNAKLAKISSVSRDDILAAVSTNAVSKITVAMLREFLTSEGVTNISKLTKPALIEKIKEQCLS